MMKRKKGIWLGAAAVLLCAIVLFPTLVSGSGVTESDPLISLSYLNGAYQDQVLQQSQQQIASAAQSLQSALDSRAAAVNAAAGAPIGDATTHTPAVLPAGSSYTVSEGAEFLFLSGSAKVTAAGLTDTTDGASVPADGVLQPNHLYIAGGTVSIQAADAAKLLIRK